MVLTTLSDLYLTKFLDRGKLKLIDIVFTSFYSFDIRIFNNYFKQLITIIYSLSLNQWIVTNYPVAYLAWIISKVQLKKEEEHLSITKILIFAH